MTKQRERENGLPQPAVLRVKQGCNPNSSSVGSQIPLFLGAALGAGACTVVALQLLLGTGRQLRRARARLCPEPAAVPPRPPAARQEDEPGSPGQSSRTP